MLVQRALVCLFGLGLTVVLTGPLPAQDCSESAPEVFARFGAGDPQPGVVAAAGGYYFYRIVNPENSRRPPADSVLAIKGAQAIIQYIATTMAKCVADVGLQKDLTAFLCERTLKGDPLNLGWQIVWSGYEDKKRVVVIAMPRALLSPVNDVPSPYSDLPMGDAESWSDNGASQYVTSPVRFTQQDVKKLLLSTPTDLVATALLCRLSDASERPNVIQSLIKLAVHWSKEPHPEAPDDLWVLQVRARDQAPWKAAPVTALFDIFVGRTGSRIMAAMAAEELQLRGYEEPVRELAQRTNTPLFRDGASRKQIELEIEQLAHLMNSDADCLLGLEYLLWIGSNQSISAYADKAQANLVAARNLGLAPMWVRAVVMNGRGAADVETWAAAAADFLDLGFPYLALACADACLSHQAKSPAGRFVRWEILMKLQQVAHALSEAHAILSDVDVAQALTDYQRKELSSFAAGKTNR